MSSDFSITAPFQGAVVMPGRSAALNRLIPGRRGSPAQRADAPGLRGVAGGAGAPGHQPQRGRGFPALGAVDELVRVGAGLADLLRAFLVDRLVAPAGAAEMVVRASSVLDRNGVPPGLDYPRRYSRRAGPGRHTRPGPVRGGPQGRMFWLRWNRLSGS